jgi:hypothetical protein
MVLELEAPHRRPRLRRSFREKPCCMRSLQKNMLFHRPNVRRGLWARSQLQFFAYKPRWWSHSISGSRRVQDSDLDPRLRRHLGQRALVKCKTQKRQGSSTGSPEDG